ncbi:MAG TPA: hypothetical protein VK426_00215 [Methanobacterium sp.]|nr:hypothetical protein [Methanobacterium sp.]
MSNIERFKEILIQVPFDRYDLSLVNRREYQPLFEELFEIYRNSNGTERSLITEFVKSELDLSYKLVHWHPHCKKTDPNHYLELKLMSVLIRDGTPDFRDDLLSLVYFWDFAEEKGINAEELFKEINEMADSSLFHQVMDPDRRKGLRII